MKVEILRGKEQIGGNIIKVTSGSSSILLDCGQKLPIIGEKSKEDDFDLSRIGKVDALFLSHHHGDHSGLLEKLPREIPLYTSPDTLDFMNRLDLYLDRPLRTRDREIHGLFSGETVKIGDITVRAYCVEHSAEGAMAFLLEAEGKTLLYTGDFKENFIRSSKGIDLLLTEGTMLDRDEQEYPDEDAVEAEFRRLFRTTEGRVFVLASSANLPRIRSVLSARNHVCPDRLEHTNLNTERELPRPVMQDVFMKYCLENTGHGDLAAPYGFVWKVFSGNGREGYDRIARQYSDMGVLEGQRRIMDKDRALVFLRPSMLPLMEKLAGEGMDLSADCLVFSMWKGYMADPQVKALVELFREKGAQIRYVHTSGHADRKKLAAMIGDLRPRRIACIHSDAPGRIRELAGEIPVEEGAVIEL